MTSSIVLAKKLDTPLTELQRETLAGVLFDLLGGLSEVDQKRWRYFWRELMAAGSGELFTLQYSIERNGIFHRRHMKMESVFFENQEAFSSFPQFRAWLKTGAGFCDFGLVRGQMVAVPKSIAYEQCDQVTMEQFHNDAIAFMRTARAQQELYPHLSAAMAEDMIETLIREFEE